MRGISQMDDRELIYTEIYIFLFLMAIAMAADFAHYYLLKVEMVYGVSVGPITEEVLKGGALVLLLVVFLYSFPNSWDRLTGKRAWVVGGALVGLGFGLVENWTTYTLSTARIMPTLNHAAWTALVGLGIWVYMDSGREGDVEKIGIPFTVAVISHMVWNYYAYLVGTGQEGIIFAVASWAMTVLALILVWKTEFRL